MTTNVFRRKIRTAEAVLVIFGSFNLVEQAPAAICAHVFKRVGCLCLTDGQLESAEIEAYCSLYSSFLRMLSVYYLTIGLVTANFWGYSFHLLGVKVPDGII